MWLAAIDWGNVGPVLLGIAGLGGLIVTAWEKWQTRRALAKADERVEQANGKLTGAFKLIDELQEQLREEWQDKRSFRDTIRELQTELRESFEEKAELIRQLRESQATSDELFQENQGLKRKGNISKSASKKSSRQK